MHELNGMGELKILEEIQSKAATALYFKGERCSVCSVLEPKIKALLHTEGIERHFYLGKNLP